MSLVYHTNVRFVWYKVSGINFTLQVLFKINIYRDNFDCMVLLLHLYSTLKMVMKGKKVFKMKNMPSRPPVFSSVLCYLSLEYWKAPEYLYGVFGVLFALIWITYIVAFFTEEEVDLFEGK